MTETMTPYEDRKLEELRDELGRRKLPVSGTKAELADRLYEDDAAFTDDDQDYGEDEKPVEKTKAEKAAERRECVVDDGTDHTGRATPGADICSAHAMHYRADGTPRNE